MSRHWNAAAAFTPSAAFSAATAFSFHCFFIAEPITPSRSRAV